MWAPNLCQCCQQDTQEAQDLWDYCVLLDKLLAEATICDEDT